MGERKREEKKRKPAQLETTSLPSFFYSSSSFWRVGGRERGWQQAYLPFCPV